MSFILTVLLRIFDIHKDFYYNLLLINANTYAVAMIFSNIMPIFLGSNTISMSIGLFRFFPFIFS